MALTTMYAGKINSPATTLSAGIDDDDTTISVTDASVLPAGPNLAVIGTDEDAETILYTDKSGNDLTGCTREFEGTAKAWDSGTAIARLFTAYDYNTLKSNIEMQLSGAEASVSDGNTINHGLGTTPTLVLVTGTVAGEFIAVTAKSSTTFTVAIKTNIGEPGTTQTIYWMAIK